MGELPQQEPGYYNNSRQIVEQAQQARMAEDADRARAQRELQQNSLSYRGSRGVEQANDAQHQVRLETCAKDAIRNLKITPEMDGSTQEILASGWALKSGFNGDDARTVAFKVVQRMANPEQYGPLNLHFIGSGSYSAKDMGNHTRELLAARIARVTGNKQQAYLIVGAICDGD